MESAPATAVPISESRSRWWSLGALAFSLFMINLDSTVVNVALPAIERDLKIGLSQLEWIVNGYTLTFAVLLLSGGKLADFLGRRRIFMIGLAVFTASSLACGLASTGGMLIAARATQGIGAACMLPATLSIIAATFHPRERGTAIGIWSGVSAIGVALGPLVGGVLIEEIDWRWIFFVNVPIGLSGLVAARLLVPESRDRSAEQRLDVPGLATSAAALFALTFALIEANHYGWTSPAILACFAAAAVGCTAFLVIELRSRVPMLDVALFRNPTFTGANLVGLLSFFALFGVFFFISIYLQNILGYSAVRTGATFLPFTVLMVLSVPASGRLTDRVGARWPMAIGMLFLGVSLLLESSLNVDSTFWNLLPGLLIGGVGVGLTLAPTNAVALASLPDDKAGVASGVVNTFRQMGGVLGIAIMGAVLASRIGELKPRNPRLPLAFMSGFGDALLIGSVVAIVGAVVAAICITSRPLGRTPEATGPL